MACPYKRQRRLEEKAEIYKVKSMHLVTKAEYPQRNRLTLSAQWTILLLSLMPLASLRAQLDTEHWIPPFHARYDRGNHYLYLTTPETLPFDVSLSDGTGSPIQDANGNPLSSITISNSAPKAIYLGNGDNPQNGLVTLTSTSQLNKPLNNKGIIAVAAKPFYANFRVRSSDQADLLTAKGKVAMGKSFRIGHVFNEIVPIPSWNRRSNFAGIMATTDGTEVEINGFSPGMTWMSEAGNFNPPPTVKVTLNRGQSYVISTYVDITRPSANRNGLQGALITASSPIVVNCGSWLGSPVTDGLQDIGFDQIVPVERTGTEYIVIRGDGPDELETPLVIATEDGTDVFIGSNPVPVTTLDAGELFRVPPGSYTSNQNLYLRSGKPTYLFQMLGGANQKQTGGLNFLPPLGCAEGGSVNNIMDINKIGNTTYEGKLLILAETGKTVSINGTPIPPSQFKTVDGKPEYMTYKAANLSGNVRVDSDGSLQIGVLGRNNNAGWAGYFSGFDVINPPEVAISLSSNCQDTIYLKNLSNADSILWYRDGAPLFLKTDSLLYPVPPGTYYAIARREFCNELLWDTSEVVVIPKPLQPQVSIQPSLCPGKGNGSFQIDSITGGYPPFEVSFDGGFSFTDTFSADSLEAGQIDLIFKDSLGCLHPWTVLIPLAPDYPLVQIDQPDTLDCLTDTIILSAGASSSGPDFLYQWENFDGTPLGPIGAAKAEVTEAGLYILSIIQKSTGCRQEDTVVVEVARTSPSVMLEAPTPITCRDSVTLLTAYGDSMQVFQYDWAKENGPTLGGQSPNILVSEPGMYSLTVTDPRNGCTGFYSTVVVENKSAPTADILVSGQLDCLMDSVILSINQFTDRPLSCVWVNPNGATGLHAPNGNLIAKEPGKYTLTLTDTINGCFTVVTAVVPKDTMAPAVDAGPDKQITCSDTLITLNGNPSLCDDCLYSWSSPVDNWISAPKSTITLVRDTGLFYLTVTDTLNGCSAVDSAMITGSPPIVGASIRTALPSCEVPTGSIAFQSIIGGTEPFQYSFDGGLTFSDSPTLDPAPGGTYTLMVSDIHGCTFLDSVKMTEVLPVRLTLDSILILDWGTAYTLQPKINLPPNAIASWSWQPKDYLSCSNCPEPSASPHQSISYTVTAKDTFGCVDSAEIRLLVLFEADIFIPTGFHPDRNGINDGFTLFGDPRKVARILYLSIYDRWGNELFKGEDLAINDAQQGWDGTFRGKDLDPAIFVYSAEVEMANGERRKFSGEVHLIR